MKYDFLHRTKALLGSENLKLLEKSEIAISGLGGVGGAAFMTLLRCGVKRFRLAENGIFDPPDMNRQWGAFSSTMGHPKLDVYVHWAKEINPEVELKLYPEGINIDNIEDFLRCANAYIGVIDMEKGQDVKEKSSILCRHLSIPLFTAGAIGFGAIMLNYDPSGMTPEEFFRAAMKKSDSSEILPSYLIRNFNQVLIENSIHAIQSGVLATSSIGAAQAGIILASEVITYLLKDTSLTEREVVFAPRYVCFDLMQMRFQVEDIRN